MANIYHGVGFYMNLNLFLLQCRIRGGDKRYWGCAANRVPFSPLCQMNSPFRNLNSGKSMGRTFFSNAYLGPTCRSTILHPFSIDCSLCFFVMAIILSFKNMNSYLYLRGMRTSAYQRCKTIMSRAMKFTNSGAV